MRWVDSEFIKENEDPFLGVYDSFQSCGVETFVAQKLTKWNDELIMQCSLLSKWKDSMDVLGY